ncbi:MAG TPA: HD-GYP domain-containing protein [Baekduia sp.]|nr:HD-GYP domain-containing protein [Baekduia sp.]
MEDMPGKGTTTDVAVLQKRLASVEQSAAQKEQQLERYAADLRETFKRERERRHELRRSYMATVRALCNAVEARDAYTGKHAERVAAYGMEIAKVLDAPFSEDPEVEFGFLLHDVGKVAVPDSILWKPEPLTPEERTLMERHPLVGWEILREIDFLGEAKLVVRHHHERWDGAGYPDGLAGDLIPLAARVFAVADVLDALTTLRPYRAPSELMEARGMIEEASGTQFDPEVVTAFMEIPAERLDQIRVEAG